ncbi:FAD-dependent oxidoreductase FixC [Escherichia coli]|nr:FAD-dependent oxidoreductase [Escherichia coli]HAY4216902.1 FAD-dependent oxidoreductase [Escherichia coli]HBM8441325.1 FAD-dependent oxidoreductase [Escherichia coli]HCP5924631.1 FAD-dependent oxidoreductase [Escherichia coli]
MSEDIFDAIIVGAGLAGSVAALVLAREGAQVLVIERGNSAGAKNVTGGRLYAHSLEHIIPGFADSAPVERLITHEKLAFMTEKSAMTMDYCNGDETSPSQRSYSVLRSKFDAWLMEQAEEAGAQLITGIRVDNLVQRDGKVVGVEADGDVIEAKTVILADGVNSILAEKLGMAKRVKPTDVAVGVKELIELPKSVIEDRFQLQGNQGAACLFAGSPTDGLMGGGFLYTNENTLSLGLVCGLHHLHDAKKSVPQMLEDFKQHPAVAPLIAGGKLVEYSAHVVPEAGINMLPELVGDGVLIAGDAAGEAAAKTVLSAMKSDDFSKQKLAEYRQHLESGPLRDMRMYQKLPAFLDNPRMFSGYPELAVGVARDLFTIDGSAPELMRKKILRHGKKVGFINLIKDGMKGVTVL